MKVVIDTNIIISASKSPKGAANKIIELIDEEKIQVCICTEILNEYKSVLSYEKFKINPERQKEILVYLEKNGILLKPKKVKMK